MSEVNRSCALRARQLIHSERLIWTRWSWVITWLNRRKFCPSCAKPKYRPWSPQRVEPQVLSYERARSSQGLLVEAIIAGTSASEPALGQRTAPGLLVHSANCF